MRDAQSLRDSNVLAAAAERRLREEIELELSTQDRLRREISDLESGVDSVRRETERQQAKASAVKAELEIATRERESSAMASDARIADLRERLLQASKLWEEVGQPEVQHFAPFRLLLVTYPYFSGL